MRLRARRDRGRPHWVERGVRSGSGENDCKRERSERKWRHGTGALRWLIRRRPVAHGVTPVRVHRMRDPLRGRAFGRFGAEVGRTGKFSEHFQIRTEELRFDVPLLSNSATVDFPLACEPSDVVGAESEICCRLAREKIPASIENYIRPFG